MATLSNEFKIRHFTPKEIEEGLIISTEDVLAPHPKQYQVETKDGKTFVITYVG